MLGAFLLSLSSVSAATLDASATGPSLATASSAAYALTVATTGEPFLAAPADVFTPSFVAQIHHPASFVLTSGSGDTAITFPTASHGSLATATAVVLRLHDASGPLTVQAPAGFEISLTAGSGFAANLTFTPASDDLVLHLRIAAATSPGTHSGDLAVSLADHPIDGAPLPVSARITSLSAVSDNVIRPPGQPLKISLAGLFANDLRSDDGSLALHAFSANTAQNIPLARSGAFLLYPAPPELSLADSFTYTVIDTFGATSTATVAIAIASPEPAPAATTLSIAPREGGGVILRLLGVPGRLYTIQVSTDLATWDELATATADPLGLYTIEDPIPPAPARFYRAVHNR